MLQSLAILRLIMCFRGFFFGLRAGVDEEAGKISEEDVYAAATDRQARSFGQRQR